MEFNKHGHIILPPLEFQRLAFSEPEALIAHALIPGTPRGFPTYESFTRFLDYLTARTGIHPHHFLFRGSTKIGFSISPDRGKRKTWRAFGPDSDLDLAITDPHYFATVDEEVRRWDRIAASRGGNYRYPSITDSRQYLRRIEQKGRHDCYRYFDLPPQLACLVDLQEILNQAPISDCCVYRFVDFKAFIFRDRWAVHRRYQTDLDELRRGLTASSDPLPQAPEGPFPPLTP